MRQERIDLERLHRAKQELDHARKMAEMQAAADREEKERLIKGKKLQRNEDRNRRRRIQRAANRDAKGSVPPAAADNHGTATKPSELTMTTKNQILVPPTPVAQIVRRIPITTGAERQRRTDATRRTRPNVESRALPPIRPASPDVEIIVNDSDYEDSQVAPRQTGIRRDQERDQHHGCSRLRLGKRDSEDRRHDTDRLRHRPVITRSRSRSPSMEDRRQRHRYSDNHHSSLEGDRSSYDRPVERGRTRDRLAQKPVSRQRVQHPFPDPEGHMARRGRSDGPRAYGLCDNRGGRSGADSDEELGSIKEQRRAFESRALKRAERKFQVEAKEARRAEQRKQYQCQQQRTEHRRQANTFPVRPPNTNRDQHHDPQQRRRYRGPVDSDSGRRRAANAAEARRDRDIIDLTNLED